MYDRGLGVLEQYGLTAETVLRGRGALICQTEKGWKSIREYWGSPGRLEQQRKIQKRCKETGFLLVDQVEENLEGQVVTTGEDGIPYVVKEWFQGTECNTRSGEDILSSMEAMAKLHTVMQAEQDEDMPGADLLEECRRHNRELRRTRKFVQKKKAKNPFEERLAKSITAFLEAGERMVKELEDSDYERFCKEHRQEVCHGDCNQHNMLRTAQGVRLVNYENLFYGEQMVDLANYLRKILEKNSWSTDMGKHILEAYEKQRKLCKEEKQLLHVLLLFPEKFWKVSNHYSNSHKAWVSGRDIEKLNRLIAAEPAREHFLENLFSFL